MFNNLQHNFPTQYLPIHAIKLKHHANYKQWPVAIVKQICRPVRLTSNTIRHHAQTKPKISFLQHIKRESAELLHLIPLQVIAQ